MMNTVLNNDEQWKRATDSIADKTIPFQMGCAFSHHAFHIHLVIDMDPGGGFESGFELTSLSADIPMQFTSFSTALENDSHFQFSIHPQGMLQRIGKIFGMEDIIMGNQSIDDMFIFKSNQPEKLKFIFEHETIQTSLLNFPGSTIQLSQSSDEDEKYTLEWMLEHAIFDVHQLKSLYDSYTIILDRMFENQPNH